MSQRAAQTHVNPDFNYSDYGGPYFDTFSPDKPVQWKKDRLDLGRMVTRNEPPPPESAVYVPYFI